MVEVSITLRHIARGQRLSYNLDAFGLAVSDAITTKMKQRVGTFKVIATNRDVLFIDGYLIEIPEVAQEFIRKSDYNKPLDPIRFLLDIPDELFEPREHQRYE